MYRVYYSFGLSGMVLCVNNCLWRFVGDIIFGIGLWVSNNIVPIFITGSVPQWCDIPAPQPMRHCVTPIHLTWSHKCYFQSNQQEYGYKGMEIVRKEQNYPNRSESPMNGLVQRIYVLLWNVRSESVA